MNKLSSTLFVALLLLAGVQSRAASTLLAGWDFQTTAGGGTAAVVAPGSPTTYLANAGTGIGVSGIYLNGRYGASTWITANAGNEVSSFGGSSLNVATGMSNATTSSLALVGGTGTSANGKRMVFKFSMTGYSKLVISYATQSTGTGFSTHTWEYSTDSVNWSGAQAIGSIPTSFAVKILDTITGLDNAATAYIRFTPTGASGASGNTRLDNIQFNAFALPATYLTATALHKFATTCINTTAGPDSFTITGVGLTTANVTVGASTGYTYATSYAGPFSTSLSLVQAGGAYSQKVYVTFNPTAVQNYYGTIAVGGGGATSINVVDSGVGINTPPTLSTGGASNITSSSSIDTGFVSANGCSPFTGYGIEYSTTNNFVTGTGTQIASSNLSGGIFTSSLTSLSSGTVYYYRAYVSTAYGTYYGAQKSFLTVALSPVLTTSSLNPFGNVCTGSTGGPNSFTISGVSLTAADINVGPLAGYTFSTTSGGTYTSSLTLTQGGGGLYSQQVFVKFAPTLVQSYAGTIPVTGGGSTDSANVAASGTGVAPPAQPSAISGPAAPCKSTAGINYSVTNVPGTTYTWVLPSGWTKTAGGTTNAITVTTTTSSGTISVTPNNGYCDGTPSTLAVTSITIPSQPSAISGSLSVCAGATGIVYSVTNVTGITYTWSLPSGWVQTGGGTTNSITVSAGSVDGTLTVTPSNGNCTGTARTLSISVDPLPSVTASNSGPVCKDSAFTLRATGSDFMTYQWSNGTATSGQIYQQNFNSLPSTGTSVTWVDNSTIPGWYASSSNLASNGLVLGTGSSNAGNLYNYGLTNATDRALGSQASSSTGTLNYGLRLTNTTGAPVDRIFVQYTGEQWRDGGSGAVPNSLTFSYSATATAINTGSYTNVTALDYTTTVASGTGSGAAVNGNTTQVLVTSTINLGTLLTSGGTIWLRWTDIDNTGSDMGNALDDVTVILYNSSNTLLDTPSAAVSTATYAASGELSSAVYKVATGASASGTYTLVAANPSGCTSTTSTSLTVKQPATSTTALSVCAADLPYTWNGLTFSAAGTQTAHLNGSNSCDSAATLTLTVNQPTTSTNSLSVCSTALPYTWNSLTFSGAGTQTAHLTGSNGCDSAATLTLTVVQPATAVANATGNATINNTATYTLSGSATGYSTYSWSTTGAGSLTGTNTLTPTYHPATNELGTITVRLTANSQSPCAGSVRDSMTITLTASGNVWIGNTSDWFTGSNWTSGSAPNSCSTPAVIGTVTGGHVYPVLTGSAQVSNLTINSGAQITVNSGLSLSICGDWTGGATTAATVAGAGSIVLNGTTVQTVSGNTTLNTLTVNKTTGAATISGTVNVNTALVLTRGNVTAASSSVVTLKSTASNTAYLDNFTSATAGAWSGNVTVERYIANPSIGYRDLSPPVSNAKVADWAADFNVTGQNGVNCWYAYSPYPTLQYYSEPTNSPTSDYYGGFISTTAGTNALTPMKGYAARMYTTPLMVTTTGTPNNASVSLAITKTASSTPAADGWNLIGNPYPSPISWNAVKALNNGKTDGAAYLCQASGEYTGNWAVWNGTVGTNGATDQIGSTQGFMILASGNSTLTINNTVRVAATAVPYFKTRAAQQDEVRLELTGAGNSDEIVSYSDANASTGYDAGYDATKIAAGSTVYLSFDMAARQLAINVMNQLTETSELPLKIAVTDSGAYTLTATTLNTDGLTAYLKDAQTGTLTDLSTTAPVLQLGAAQYYTGRYSVVFRKKSNTNTTAVENMNTDGQARIYAYQNKIYITRSSSNAADVEVTNLLGQTVAQLKTNTEKAEYEMTATEPWYAIVKLNENGKVTVQKVLITSK